MGAEELIVIENRRADDPRIDQLVADVAGLQVEMQANTAVTTQVRDILASFRVMALIAKWIAAIGAGFAAVYNGFDFLRKHL